MRNGKNTALKYAFLGQGWRFPIEFNPDEGSVHMVGGIEDIEQSLRILIDTLPGERVTNLRYGCRLKEKLYDPIDGKLTYLAEEAIKNAIDFYEPRIKLENVKLMRQDELEGLITIELTYVVKLTNSRYNMVYPFAELESKL